MRRRLSMRPWVVSLCLGITLLSAPHAGMATGHDDADAPATKPAGGDAAPAQEPAAGSETGLQPGSSSSPPPPGEDATPEPDAMSEMDANAASTETVAVVAESPQDDGLIATATVERLHETLMQAMRNSDSLGFEGRYEKIVAALDETFDLAFMARTSIGSAWKELDDAERADFVALSRKLSASNYADNFDGYGGQRFVTLSHEPAARRTLLVKTRFEQPDDDDVDFDYRLRKRNGRWWIIDVTLDGQVSELTLRRADYRSVIERKGFPYLVADLEEKVDNLWTE